MVHRQGTALRRLVGKVAAGTPPLLWLYMATAALVPMSPQPPRRLRVWVPSPLLLLARARTQVRVRVRWVQGHRRRGRRGAVVARRWWPALERRLRLRRPPPLLPPLQVTRRTFLRRPRQPRRTHLCPGPQRLVGMGAVWVRTAGPLGTTCTAPSLVWRRQWWGATRQPHPLGRLRRSLRGRLRGRRCPPHPPPTRPLTRRWRQRL